ncbi:MAG: glycosyltransferase family 4 protein [Acidobacteriota bacterium]|nr:MAG: glycosyltransferase family 4 protein [Acidobacteriota bacterium]
MKILVISNLFPPHVLGGYEILCGQVCNELQLRGHSITVLTSTHGLEANPRSSESTGVYRTLQLYLPFDQPARLMRTRRWNIGRQNYIETRKILKHERPDLIFIWSQLRLTLGAARAAQDSGIPVAFTLNDEHIAGYLPSPFGWSPKTFLRYLADHWVFPSITLRGLQLKESTCISQRLQTNLVALGVPVSSSEVIYQGIPLERFPCKENLGEIGSPVRILYVGQLHPYKGVHTLLEAVGQIARRSDRTGDPSTGPQIHLTVVGTGPENYIRKLSEIARSIPAEIHFAGKLSHEELPEIYRSHHIFVFPSIWQEPFGLTHLESMASGTTVISTAEGGQGEFLEHGQNALVFQKEDSKELACHLGRLLSEPGLSFRLARQARFMVEEQFSLQKYVSRLEEFLRAVAVRRVGKQSGAGG